MSSDNIRLSTGCAPRLLTMAGASSGVTLWYIVRFALRVSTSGPAAHKPIQPTPFTLHLCSSPRDFTSASRAFLTWSLREERQLAATHTCTACSKGASDSRCCSAISWSSSRFNADLHLSRLELRYPTLALGTGVEAPLATERLPLLRLTAVSSAPTIC